MLIFKIKGIGWDLSMMRVKYKLTKRTTNTKKIEKSSKIYSITTFKTIRYKLTASGKFLFIQFSITSFWDLSTNYGYLKNNKQAKAANSKKENKNSVEAFQKYFLSVKNFLSTVILVTKMIFIINLTSFWENP